MRNKRDKLTFTNARMFSLVMQNEDICKGLLERILGREIDNLAIENKYDLSTEETIVAAIRAKGVRLDVKFTDDNNLYCIEMQVGVEKSIAQRSGYYHSVLTVSDMGEGDNYEDMKPTYVIFLCCYDPMKMGEPVYSFEMYDKAKDLSLGEKRYTILLNSKAKDMPSELRDLFIYMNKGIVTEGDELIERIDENVRKYADGKVGAAIMEWEYEYNQQIKALQKKIAELEESKAEDEETIAELKEANAEKDRRIAELEKKDKD